MRTHLTAGSLFLLRAVLTGLLLVVLSAGSAIAQTVSGRVVTQADDSLPGAQITLSDVRTSEIRYGAVADETGSFRMDGVRPGEYLLAASFVGYATYEELLLVSPGEFLQVEVSLAPRLLLQEEVIVTATRARSQITPITFTNLSARELEEQPSMKDLPVLLATLPSTTYYSENGNGIGYSTLRMRGFDQRRIAVAINGIPQNDPEDFNVFWINFFDVQQAIDDVQVQRGAGSAFYGPTGIGGAVNIVARPYKPYPYAEADVGYGSFDTRRYAVEANTGLLQDRYVVFGRLSRLLSDGYREWSWSEFYRFFAGVARYGDRSTLILQTYGGPQRDGLAFSGIPKSANADRNARRANPSSFTGDVEDFHQPHVELIHELDISHRASLHQSLFWMKGKGYFDFGGTFRSPQYLRLPDSWRGLSDAERQLPLFVVAPDASLLFRAYLDQWQIGWLPHVALRHGFGETTLGAEARLHRSLRWGRMENAEALPMEMVGSENDVRVYSFRGEKVISSAYARHLYRAGDRYAIQGDLQLTYRHYRVYDERYYGHHFRKPYVFINPRIGITIRPEQPLSAYASLAWANREPRLKSLYDGEEAGAGFEPRFERRSDGTFDYDRPLVEPERLVDAELGLRIQRDRYRLLANVFWMEFWDEIVPSGGLDQFGVPRTGNADRTRHIGLEIEGEVALSRHLSLYGNATLSRNRFVRFTEFVSSAGGEPIGLTRDGNPIAGFPEQMGNVGMRYAAAGLVARLNATAAGRQYVDNSGGSPGDDFVVDPYVLVNASLQYEPPFADGLRLSFDVNNALDSKVLLFGNVGVTGPQFFPTATRHAFWSIGYTIR